MALIFILYVSAVVSAGAGGDDGEDDRRRIFEANGFRNHPGPKTCPRCHSNDTKFSYYNNRSLAQPRYFCRRCRRSWTHGGVIRDVPVGGRRRSVARRPRVVPRVVFPPDTNIASISRQPGQIMLDSPLPTTHQLGGVPPRAAAGPSNNVSYEHSMNRMMRTFRFGPMTNFEELPGPMAERLANVPGWNVDNSVPLPPPPPPPQPQLVNVNHAENDDNIMDWSIDDFMGSGEF